MSFNREWRITGQHEEVGKTRDSHSQVRIWAHSFIIIFLDGFIISTTDGKRILVLSSKQGKNGNVVKERSKPTATKPDAQMMTSKGNSSPVRTRDIEKRSFRSEIRFHKPSVVISPSGRISATAVFRRSTLGRLRASRYPELYTIRRHPMART